MLAKQLVKPKRCVYCARESDLVPFVGGEHVLQHCISRRVDGNLVIRAMVCDFCNHALGSNIDFAVRLPFLVSAARLLGQDVTLVRGWVGKEQSVVLRADTSDGGPYQGAKFAVVLGPEPRLSFSCNPKFTDDFSRLRMEKYWNQLMLYSMKSVIERAVCKIAMNYLAWTWLNSCKGRACGHNPYHLDYRRLRQFIEFGESFRFGCGEITGEVTDCVDLGLASYQQHSVRLVTEHTMRGRELVAYVSLFGFQKWRVLLRVLHGTHGLFSGHVWDLWHRRYVSIASTNECEIQAASEMY